MPNYRPPRRETEPGARGGAQRPVPGGVTASPRGSDDERLREGQGSGDLTDWRGEPFDVRQGAQVRDGLAEVHDGNAEVHDGNAEVGTVEVFDEDHERL